MDISLIFFDIGLSLFLQITSNVNFQDIWEGVLVFHNYTRELVRQLAQFMLWWCTRFEYF